MLTDSQKENQISKDGKIAEHYEEIMECCIRWIIKVNLVDQARLCNQ